MQQNHLFLSIGFLVNCIIQYKFLPDHPTSEDCKDVDVTNGNVTASRLPRWKELTTYGVFIFAVIGMLLQSKIGDAGYAMAGLSVAVILLIGVLDFKEIRDAISAPIILMSAGVIGVADALGSTGLTNLVGTSVAGMLGTNVNPFVMIFAFCILTQSVGYINRIDHWYSLCIYAASDRYLQKFRLRSYSRSLRHRDLRLVWSLPAN